MADLLSFLDKAILESPSSALYDSGFEAKHSLKSCSALSILSELR